MPLSPADYEAAAKILVSTVTLSCSVKRTVHDHEADVFRSVEANVGWTFKAPPVVGGDGAGDPAPFDPHIAHALYVLHMPRLYRECYSALAVNEVLPMAEAKRLIERVEAFYLRVRTPEKD